MRRYLQVLRRRRFGVLWAGATASILGDGMTLVALTWLVLERTGSPLLVGLLAFAFTAPVVVGGLAAGLLLDRFDKRTVLMADTAARAVVTASVPLLAVLDALPVWWLFVVAAVYGLLKMIPLAGVPAVIPALVDEDDLTTANALESISFGIGGIGGPALAGVLIAAIGAPAVVAVDALSYAVFLLCLAAIPRMPPDAVDAAAAGASRRGIGPAIELVVSAPAILATTLMFMAFNIGEGIFVVLVPVYVVEVLGRDATAYGALLAAFSVGLLVGSAIVGAVPTPVRLGRAIAIGQLASGILLAAYLLEPGYLAALAIGAVFGAAASPLTIWAQTIRMQLIPPELRGRVFALLRTMMQSTPPLGALLAGILLGGGRYAAAVVAASLLVAVPGAVGLVLPALAGPFRPAATASSAELAAATDR
jgi:MFS family permease